MTTSEGQSEGKDVTAYTNPLPRIVVYYQTHHDKDGNIISTVPLTQPGVSVTHINLAAFHINEDPHHITLNDHSPDHPMFEPLWPELRKTQEAGVKVMGMLGGAGAGSYTRLDGSQEQFEKYYIPFRDMVRKRNLDGLDLDVEEEMSLEGIVRLIDRLKKDFGKDFIITFAPVAKAMLDPAKNLSGFDYMKLEAIRGNDIAWYNTQFYCGWGDLTNTAMYESIIENGWNPKKIVIGVVTNPKNANGFVSWEVLSPVLTVLKQQNKNFGGVMGWEYFNSLPGDIDCPSEWARLMTLHLRTNVS